MSTRSSDIENAKNISKKIIGLFQNPDNYKIENIYSDDRANFELFSKSIFIVHGHDTDMVTKVDHTLRKLGLTPIILHEQANAGKTIIEKFEHYSAVNFAVVLLTDDDAGKAKKEEALNSRARQNVILELGYFFGKLGRNRVCSLYTKGVELPSDLHGLLYIEIDPADYWKLKLAKELAAAGFDIDINRII